MAIQLRGDEVLAEADELVISLPYMTDELRLPLGAALQLQRMVSEAVNRVRVDPLPLVLPGDPYQRRVLPGV